MSRSLSKQQSISIIKYGEFIWPILNPCWVRNSEQRAVTERSCFCSSDQLGLGVHPEDGRKHGNNTILLILQFVHYRLSWRLPWFRCTEVHYSRHMGWRRTRARGHPRDQTVYTWLCLREQSRAPLTNSR